MSFISGFNRQKLNFHIEGESAELELNGNKAFIYINQKKITLTLDPGKHHISSLESYLNDHKEKIRDLLHQHHYIEKAYGGKPIRLLNGGRFQYYTNQGELKETSLQDELASLQRKVKQEGPKSKWMAKAERIKTAIEEINFLYRKEKKSETCSKRPSIDSVEENPRYLKKPLQTSNLIIQKDCPVTEIVEKHRRAVRNKTKKKVEEKVSISSGRPKKHFYTGDIFEETRLYQIAQHDFETFMGPLDVLQIPVKIDFDETWTPIYYSKQDQTRWIPQEQTKVLKVKVDKRAPSQEKLFKGKRLAYHKPSLKEYRTPQNSFFCHYIKGIEIKPGGIFFEGDTFDEEKFLRFAGKGFYQALQAQKASGAKHIFWDSSAIEGSLKTLSEIDFFYQDKENITELRYKLAIVFKDVIEDVEFENLHLHLCLSTGKGMKDQNPKEDIQNYNALISAFSSTPKALNTRIMIYRNADMPVLAQDLAEKEGKGTVSMVLRMKGKSLGNDWLKHPEQDNFHCRSSSAAATACLLDKGVGAKPRTHDLGKRVEKLGGEVVFL